MSKRRSEIGQDTVAAWARLVEQAKEPPARTMTVGEHLRDEQRQPKKVDRRSLRKTGRTEQFNVRLKSATKQEIQRLADDNGWLIGEAIEHAVAALNEKLTRTK